METDDESDGFLADGVCRDLERHPNEEVNEWQQMQKNERFSTCPTVGSWIRQMLLHLFGEQFVLLFQFLENPFVFLARSMVAVLHRAHLLL